MVMFLLTMIHEHVKHTTVTSPVPLNLSHFQNPELQESLWVAIFLHLIPAPPCMGVGGGILVFQKDILAPTITEWWQPLCDPSFQTYPTLLLLQYVPTISGSAAVLCAFIIIQGTSWRAHGFRASVAFGKTWWGVPGSCGKQLREGPKAARTWFHSYR